MNNWNQLGDDSKVWMYGANRKLTSDECEEINKLLDHFCDRWAAHGAKLECGFQILYSQLIVLAVDEVSAQASGCSIDKSVQIFREIDTKYEIDLFNRLRSYRLDGESLTAMNSGEIAAALSSGKIDEHTLFIDPMVSTMADIKQHLTKPLQNTWLKKYLNPA